MLEFLIAPLLLSFTHTQPVFIILEPLYFIIYFFVTSQYIVSEYASLVLSITLPVPCSKYPVPACVNSCEIPNVYLYNANLSTVLVAELLG